MIRAVVARFSHRITAHRHGRLGASPGGQRA
jgi:hypothetical protein